MKSIKELPGTQLVRYADVLILAPLMIKASKSDNLTKGQQNFLFWAGVGTAVFNGVNIVRHW